MNTKDIIKYVLIAAGVYIVYVWARDSGWLASLGIGTQALPAPGAQPITGAPGNAAQLPAGSAGKVQAPGAVTGKETAITQPAKETSSTRDLVAALAQGDAYQVNGKMTFEHWSYYYNTQTPAGKLKPAPGPGEVGVDPSTPITVDQWWSVMQGQGFSGLSALSRWAPNPWVV